MCPIGKLVEREGASECLIPGVQDTLLALEVFREIEFGALNCGKGFFDDLPEHVTIFFGSLVLRVSA